MESQSFFTIVLTVLFFVTTITTQPINDTQSDSAPSTASTSINCPWIVTRAEWKARKPRAREPMPYTPTPFVVVHHGGIAQYCYDQARCSAIVRSYQNLHMDKNKWDDIGYSFVIGEDGHVYEGRGWNYVGAHAPKYNNQSIGICIMGDFTKFMPNEAALKALTQLIDCGVALGKIRKDYHVVGHRQVRNTECPGETFYKYVQGLPRWTDKPAPITNSSTTTTATTTTTASTTAVTTSTSL